MVRKPLYFCLCALVVLTGRLQAEDVTFEQLLERLHETESRLQQLEQQNSVFRSISFGQDSGPIGIPPAEGDKKSGDEKAGDEKADDKKEEKKETELESLTKKWEEKWEEQEETNAELQSALKKAVVVGTSKTKTMKLSGRIHADYWGIPSSSPGIDAIEGTNPQSRLGFRRMRFGVAGDVLPNVGYKIEMEFAGGNDSEFRDAYITVRDLSFLNTVLVGNHKRPYGLDHLNSSRYNVFLERPFVIEAINQDARRFGISSNGVSEDEAWNWRFGVWNQELMQADGQHINDHFEAEVAGRLANTYWYDETSGGRGYGHWAISGTVAHPDGANGGSSQTRFRHRAEARHNQRWINTGNIAGADTYQMIGLEKVLNIGPLQLVGEYQTLFMQRDAASDLNFHGGYVYASYFLTGEHMPWKRSTGTLDRIKPFENFFMVDRCNGGTSTGWGAWQVAARYSYADFVDDNITGGIGESLTLGVNWYWNENTRVQFNYIKGEIENNGGRSGDYDIVGTRFMIDF